MVRAYEKISNERRKALIELIEGDNLGIKVAAKTLGIPYENAKAILRVYRKDQRLKKCPHRFRKISGLKNIEADYDTYLISNDKASNSE
jgi:transposase